VSGDLLPILMMLGLIVGIFAGYPVAWVLAGLGVLFFFIGDFRMAFFGTVVSRTYGGVLANWLLLAAPLFVFMGLMLERSGMAERLLLTLERMMGRLRGGLACAVILVGVILAASTGIIGASVVLLGVLALPVMLQRGYAKGVSLGVIAASSVLGILIPPSIMLVFMGEILQVPVGDLFLAAVVPGLLLASLYALYIVVLGWAKPATMPLSVRSQGPDEGRLWLDLLRDLVGPLVLILSVLGSILAGFATPTEAAAIGALGATLLAFASGRLSWRVLRVASRDTAKLTAMVMFVMIGATCFSVVFKQLGGTAMIERSIEALDLGPYGTLLVICGIIFLLGFVLDWIEICFIVLPLFAPIIAKQDFGVNPGYTLVWFATVVAVNLQSSFLTPPFGYALFYLKGVAPPGVTMPDIYRAIIPFVVLQVIGMALVIGFPDIALWLPQLK